MPGSPSTDDCSAFLQLLVDGHFSLPGNRFPQCSCQSTGQIASCHRKQQLFKAILWILRSPHIPSRQFFFFPRPAALDSSQREAKGAYRDLQGLFNLFPWQIDIDKCIVSLPCPKQWMQNISKQNWSTKCPTCFHAKVIGFVAAHSETEVKCSASGRDAQGFNVEASVSDDLSRWCSMNYIAKSKSAD